KKRPSSEGLFPLNITLELIRLHNSYLLILSFIVVTKVHHIDTCGLTAEVYADHVGIASVEGLLPDRLANRVEHGDVAQVAWSFYEPEVELLRERIRCSDHSFSLQPCRQCTAAEVHVVDIHVVLIVVNVAEHNLQRTIRSESCEVDRFCSPQMLANRLELGSLRIVRVIDCLQISTPLLVN